MTDANDWRLANAPRDLARAVMRRAKYAPTSPAWDHDHCELCGQKIADARIAEALHEAYLWQEKGRWICPACVVDFLAHFGWTILE